MDPVVHILLRLLLTAVLASALVTKLRDYARFREIVGRYEVLPPTLTGAGCTVLLSWESAALAGLWVWPQAGATLAALLFAIYAAAIAANLLRGRTHIDCGCEWGGGREPAVSNTRLTPWLPIRNLGLVLVALAIWSPVSERSLAFADCALIVPATLFFVGAFLALDRGVRQWLALGPALVAARSADV